METEIAKNLLIDHLCDSCRHHVWEMGDVEFCDADNIPKETDSYFGTKAIPKERTCKKWREYEKND